MYGLHGVLCEPMTGNVKLTNEFAISSKSSNVFATTEADDYCGKVQGTRYCCPRRYFYNVDTDNGNDVLVNPIVIYAVQS